MGAFILPETVSNWSLIPNQTIVMLTLELVLLLFVSEFFLKPFSAYALRAFEEEEGREKW